MRCKQPLAKQHTYEEEEEEKKKQGVQVEANMFAPSQPIWT